MALLGRGVYRAPCLSPNGEPILFAVDHAHRRIENGIIYVQPRDDEVSLIATLWRMLDAQDPEYARRKTPREHTKPQPSQGVPIAGALRASVAILPFTTVFALLKLAVL